MTTSLQEYPKSVAKRIIEEEIWQLTHLLSKSFRLKPTDFIKENINNDEVWNFIKMAAKASLDKPLVDPVTNNWSRQRVYYATNQEEVYITELKKAGMTVPIERSIIRLGSEFAEKWRVKLVTKV